MIRRRKGMLMRYGLVAVLLVAVMCGVALAAESMQLKDDKERISYSFGYQKGNDLKKEGVDLDIKAFSKGIQDALSGENPLMTPEEMHKAILDSRKQKLAARRSEKKQAKEQYWGEGREFLAANAEKEGVVTLPSGLQYKVIKKGTGRKPGPQDTVTVNYRGTLIDGTEFDSSYNNKPATFRVDGVIKGWTEALQLMQEGAKWKLFIPADLAYGERGPLADRTLIFEVELLSVKPWEGK
jgi:FKBP-type peptidyl-prolyl cis-trans isomerase FklB